MGIPRLAALLRLLLCAVLAFSGSACREGVEEKGQDFDIGMVTFAGYAPLYLAKEKGFFGDLSIRLHRIEEIPSIRAGVARGELEGYLATPDIFLDSDERPPGIGVWAIDESSGGDGVVVRGGLESLADLKGKRVAAEPGLPPNFVLLYLLHKNGIAMADVLFQDMTTQNAATAFVAGSIDAAGLYEPYLTLAKNERPQSKIVISSADVPGLIVDLIFVRGDVARNRAADVMKLIRGWEQAVDYIAQNKEESYNIMAKAFQLNRKEFEEIAGGVRWLTWKDNKALFGSTESPGPLFSNFELVRDVLRRNRASVYLSQPVDHLTQDFIAQVK